MFDFMLYLLLTIITTCDLQLKIKVQNTYTRVFQNKKVCDTFLQTHVSNVIDNFSYNPLRLF